MIRTYAGAFSWSDLDLGQCDVIRHRIPTCHSSPVYRQAYHIPYSTKDEMKYRVNEMLEKDIIEH